MKENFNCEFSIELLNKCLTDFNSKKFIYDQIYDYCILGESDARKNYKNNKHRSNQKVKTNFIKKFIKEEVSYLLSNRPTYISKSDNKEAIDFIGKKIGHWSKNHNKEVLRDLLSYGSVFELYYVSKKEIAGKKEYLFNLEIISPREGYALYNDNKEIILFMRFFKKKFDETQYVDVYSKNKIYHFKDGWVEDKPPTVNIFKEVPVVEDDKLYDVVTLRNGDIFVGRCHNKEIVLETTSESLKTSPNDFKSILFSLDSWSLDKCEMDDGRRLSGYMLTNEFYFTNETGDRTFKKENIKNIRFKVPASQIKR